MKTVFKKSLSLMLALAILLMPMSVFAAAGDPVPVPSWQYCIYSGDTVTVEAGETIYFEISTEGSDATNDFVVEGTGDFDVTVCTEDGAGAYLDGTPVSAVDGKVETTITGFASTYYYCAFAITNNSAESADYTCTIVFPQGSQSNPYPVTLAVGGTATVTVPAGSQYYVAATLPERYVDYQITITGNTGFGVSEGWMPTWDNNGTYVGAVASYWGPASICIVNNTGVEQTYTLALDNMPLGASSNPDTAIIGSQTATVSDNGSYHYTWMAAEDGKVTVSMDDESGWMYSVMVEPAAEDSSWYYGDTHWYDDDPVVVSETVDVEVGDIVTICVGTYDPNDMWNAPAGTVNWTLEFVDAVEHIYDDGVVTTEPTCTTEGAKIFTCTDCGETKTEVLSMLEHSYDEGKITTEPTCASAGVKTYTCTGCGVTKTESMDVLPHNFPKKYLSVMSDDTVNLSDTATNVWYLDDSNSIYCTASNGTVKDLYYCNGLRVLDDEEQSELNLDIEWYGYASLEKHSDSSCYIYVMGDALHFVLGTSSDSEKLHSCYDYHDHFHNDYCVCSLYIEENEDGSFYIYAYSDGIITTEPSCTSKGINTYTCQDCDATLEKLMPSLGHDYLDDYVIDIEPTCTTKGSKSYHCTRCDATAGKTTIPTIPHSYDEGTVITTPTCTSTGTKVATCTSCGTTSTLTMDMLAHEYDDNNCIHCDAQEFTYEIDGDEAVITGYNGSNADMVIPSTIDGLSVTSIGNSAFYNNKKISSVTIPDSVTDIGESAFENCDSLTTVTMGDGVKFIEQRAFYDCDKLTEVTFSQNLKRIENKAFKGCEALESIEIPASARVINEYAFDGCKNLSSVTIEEGLTTISRGAFRNCISLTTIDIPDSVKTIDYAVFSNCSGLISINIGSGVTGIGDFGYGNDDYWGGAPFGYCCALTEINVSEENETFASVDGVLFSKDMETLYLYPAGKTDKEYTVPYGVRYIADEAFENRDSLEKIVISDSVRTIGEYAFSDCDNLKTVILGNGVRDAGYWAFSNCDNLEEFIIGDGLTSIDGYMLSGCHNIKEITIPENVTYIEPETFEATKATIYCYSGSYAEDYADTYGYDYVLLDKVSASDGDVSISEIQSDSLAENVVLEAEKLIETQETVVYNISLTLNGEEIQPQQEFVVKIQIPDDIWYNSYYYGLQRDIGNNNEFSGKVYRVEEDGTYTDMQAVYNYAYDDDGNLIRYMVFTTDRLGEYILTIGDPADAKILLGDVNGDGKLSAIDARWALQYSAGNRELTETQIAAADANGDGKISAIDARWILQASAGNRVL